MDATKPSSISEKYSAALNVSASCASGGAKNMMSKVATVPAKNDPSAAVARARPAFPCRAIW